MRRMSRLVLSAACVVLVAGMWMPAAATVTLPHIFSSNMVVQCGSTVPVWGWADPGEEVTVTIAGQKVSAKADDQGRWKVDINPIKGGDEPLEMVVTGPKNTIKLENILAGEVWVCSGQSNMEFTVDRVMDADKEIAAADHPTIRQFKAPHVVSPRPASDVEGKWDVCSPETVKDFTAVGYFFALNIQKQLKLPVGLVNLSWGGTRIEPWTPAEAFATIPPLKDIAEQVQAANQEQVEGLPPLIPSIEAWVKTAKAAQAQGQPVPPLPPLPGSRLSVNTSPSTLFNGMVAPVIPYSMRGVLWYQGEANLKDGRQYFYKMAALINSWRKTWGIGAFPFYYVQLAPYRYGPDATLLPQIWESQEYAMTMANSGMAVTNDIGNPHDIHPKNKQEVGRRLSLWALARTYGKGGGVICGPLFRGVNIEGNKMRVTFNCAGSGLASRDGKDLTWFQVAGPDGKFVDAKATIQGNNVVVVSSDQVKQPVAIRFAWDQVAEPNLMNKEGLPAAAFQAGKVPTSQPASKPASQPSR